MSKCPECGTEGADIFLLKVFCVNSSCRHYDEPTAKQMSEFAKSAITRFVKKQRAQTEDTPVWHPKKPDDT